MTNLEKQVSNYWRVSALYNGRVPGTLTFAIASLELSMVIDSLGPQRRVKHHATRLLNEIISYGGKPPKQEPKVSKVLKFKGE